LLDKITEETKASRAYISEDEDIEVKVSGFYDRIQSPVLSDLKLDVGTGIEFYQVYPKALPDLFKGSNLLVFGRYKGNGDSRITLSGNIKGQKKEYTANVNFADDDKEYDFICPLWASRRIGHLLDLIRLNGESKELVDEVTTLAREYGIITPYTSYLILEDEELRVRRNELVNDLQTLPPRPELREMTGIDYSLMKTETGEKSINASKEVQALTGAGNFQQTQQGNARMKYKDAEGNERNLTQQVKNIQGRALYQQDKFWIDSKLQKNNDAKKIRIKFNSDEYYTLLNKEPETAQFLSLGQNVRFLYKNIFYEVYE
jgi:Ca-activated chloride channel family protein